MKQSFAPNDLSTNTRIMSAYLPPGQLFSAKDITGSNFNKLMRALAVEFGRNQSMLYQLSQQHDISTTTNLIDKWEKALGIPDDIFIDLPQNLPIDLRRKQCIAKFAKMNISTEKDWIDLAKFFDYNISIERGETYGVLPLKLPFMLGNTRTARFTIIVKFLDLDRPENIFPLKLPFKLGGSANLIQRLFADLKPANVDVIYRYKT